MTPDTSGPAWRVPLAYYDPEECCWRTSGVMFPSDWPTSSQTCPAWGMTRRGELFELPMPALPTAEPASSSLLQMLPTPNVADAVKGGMRHKGGNPTLRGVTEAGPLTPLFPTPVVNDMGAGKTPEDWDAWTARMQSKHGNGNGNGPSLSIEAQRLLPTPTASDTNGSGAHGSGGPDLRTAVSLLPTPTCGDAASARNSTATRHKIPPTGVHAGNTLTDILVPLPGASTSLLSDAGSASRDDQLPGQLSLDDEGNG